MRFSKCLLVVSCACIIVSGLTFAAPPGGESSLTTAQKARIKKIRDREARLEPRIVGGELSREGDWPGVASIGFERADGSIFNFCGGSLISAEWIVTAAHCDVRVGDKVILGRIRLSSGNGEIISVAQVITHPAYDPNTSDSDIALLKLSSSSTQTPFALITGTGTLAAPGTKITVIGWGLLEEGGQPSDDLMEVVVTVRSNPICQVDYSGTGITITGNMLCAGKTGKDSCQGDSGGPILANDSIANINRVAGIVSFGIGCARPGFPGVYTRVANFLAWIEQNTGVTPPPSCTSN